MCSSHASPVGLYTDVISRKANISNNIFVIEALYIILWRKTAREMTADRAQAVLQTGKLLLYTWLDFG